MMTLLDSMYSCEKPPMMTLLGLYTCEKPPMMTLLGSIPASFSSPFTRLSRYSTAQSTPSLQNRHKSAKLENNENLVILIEKTSQNRQKIMRSRVMVFFEKIFSPRSFCLLNFLSFKKNTNRSFPN